MNSENAQNEHWTRAHDLALIFIALAYGTDNELTDIELALITDVLQEWRDNFPADEVQDVVMESMAVFRGEEAQYEILQAIASLKNQLNNQEVQKALHDVVRIAEADGLMLNSEQSLISTVAESWGIKSVSQEMLDQSTASVEDMQAWTLMHDVGLMYLVLAHSTDNVLSDSEISVMIERLGDWRPELSEEKIREILREALRFYAESPDQKDLQESVQAIRDMLPVVQRLALLDDLLHIAQADGEVGENEREMLSTFSRAWGIGIRIDGRSPKQV